VTGETWRWWAPPLRDMDTGHRVNGYPGRRPMETRHLPGPASGLAGVRMWRARLVFWHAEFAMRAAARQMGRLPAGCHDQDEADPAAVTL
jgi:hypothetical protein